MNPSDDSSFLRQPLCFVQEISLAISAGETMTK
jgi:hypothetical protein